MNLKKDQISITLTRHPGPTQSFPSKSRASWDFWDDLRISRRSPDPGGDDGGQGGETPPRIGENDEDRAQARQRHPTAEAILLRVPERKSLKSATRHPPESDKQRRGQNASPGRANPGDAVRPRKVPYRVRMTHRTVRSPYAEAKGRTGLFQTGTA